MDQKMKNRKSILYTTIEIVLILVMTIVGNMWDWVNMEFNPSSMLTGAFWQDTFIKATLYSCALMVAIVSKMSKQELKDQRYDDLYKDYRNRLPYKELHVDEFSTFIDRQKNPDIKKEYIRTKLNAKLSRIQKFERDSWVTDYFHAKDSEEYDKYNFSSKWSKRYFIRRTRIEVMLQGDFIDKHYEEMHVKYPRLSTTSFGYYLDIKRNKDSKYKVNNEAVKDVSKQGTIKVFQTILVSIILTLFVLQPSTNALLEQANGWVVLLIKYIIRVFMVCFSFATGIWTAKRIFMDNYLLPLTNRIEILDEFKRWLDLNPVKVKGVEAIKEEVEAELKLKYEKELSEKLNTAKKEIQEQAIKLVEEFQQSQNKEQKGVA